MHDHNLFNLLLAVIKQAYKDAEKGDIEAQSFLKYLQGNDTLFRECTSTFST